MKNKVCSFIDHNPRHGNNYYRLKQIDFNGNYSYSETRRAIMESNSVSSLYPNPAQDFINIITSREIESIVIYNSTGSLVKSHVLNNYNRINIRSMETGLYTIIINYLEGEEIHRFIKI